MRYAADRAADRAGDGAADRAGARAADRAAHGAGATKRLLLGVVGAVLIMMAAVLAMVLLDVQVAGVNAQQGSRHDVEGTVVVPFGVSDDPVSCHLTQARAFEVLGGETTAPCSAGPLGDYRDVAEGTVVRVLGSSGVVLGEATLTDGVAEKGTVTFSFEVADLPETDEYRFVVNTRGAVTYSSAQLARAGWKPEVHLRAS